MTIETPKRKSAAGNALFCIAGLVLVAAALMIAFAKCKIFPFGDYTLTYDDMQYQYTDYFMWLWRVLHGKESLLYSFQNFSSNTVAFLAYYLASPFNILTYFAKESSVAEFLTVLICLKLMACYGTAFLYLSKRFVIPSVYVAIMSSAYALMGYNLLQCSNVMWLDGVIILPVLALGLYRLVSENKRVVYYLALAYGIFSNWYIGYMLCLFSVLYLGFECFLKYNTINPKLRRIREVLLRFGITSVAAVLTSCFLFFPQTLQMMRQGGSLKLSAFLPTFSFFYPNGFHDLFLNGDRLAFSQSAPMIFVGSLTLFCVVLGLISGRVSRQKKLLSMLVVFGFMFVFCFRPLCYLFTAMKIPNGHHFRFAFIYSFLLIAVAALCLEEIKIPNRQEVLKAGACILGGGLLLYLLRPYSLWNMFALSCLFCIFTGYAVATLHKGAWRSGLAILLLFGCTLCEFSLKATLEFEDHTQSTAKNEQYNQNMQAMVAELQATDPGIYRVDKTFTRASGDFGCNMEAAAFGYRGVSQYTSTSNYAMVEFASRMGYGGAEYVNTYTPNLATDAVLGVKYVYAKFSPGGYDKVGDTPIAGVGLYRNPQALAMAYKVATAEPIAYTDNVFLNQQQLYSNILGQEISLYTAADTAPPTTDGESRTEWVVTVRRSGPLYVYFENGQNGMTVFADGEPIASNYWYNNRIIDLGERTQGDTITLRIEANGRAYQSDYGADVYSLNVEEFEEAVSRISASRCEVTAMQGNHFSASYQNTTQQKETVMLTVAYEDGWSVRVNGKSVPYSKAQGCFIAFDVEPGANQIELRYHVPGGGIGVALSLLGILGFVGFGFWEEKRTAEKTEKNPKS